MYDQFAGCPLVLGLKHILCLVVIGGRSDHQNIHVSFLDHLVLVVALQLLRTFQPTETLGRSRQLDLEPRLILLVHLNVTQWSEEVQWKFWRKTQTGFYFDADSLILKYRQEELTLNTSLSFVYSYGDANEKFLAGLTEEVILLLVYLWPWG